MNEYYMIDPQTYDDQFWWKKDDIEFWKSILIGHDVTILEARNRIGGRNRLI